MLKLKLVWLLAGMLLIPMTVQADVSNIPSGQTSLEFVTIGNLDNQGNWGGIGAGAVAYEYRIGKYEVTAGQYTQFLNAVAATDTYGLYNTSMDTSSYGCQIQRSGSSGSYTYSVAGDWANRPVNYVSWGDAARFANWLHNDQPTGAQGLSTTEDGAYFLNGATSDAALLAVSREADWKWAIPTEDEWYKAAYHKNDGATGNYFDYPTSNDSTPSNDLVNPDPGNNANFRQNDEYTIGSPYYRTNVGEFENSPSPYGTFDQGGNVDEWTEASYVHVGLGIYDRILLGGGYDDLSTKMSTSQSSGMSPTVDWMSNGFRIVYVPEPTTLLMVCLGGFGLCRRRRK